MGGQSAEGGGGGLGTHWSEDEGGDWGSVGEALRAVWVLGSVGGGGGVANFEACQCFFTGKGQEQCLRQTNKQTTLRDFAGAAPAGVGGYYYTAARLACELRLGSWQLALGFNTHLIIVINITTTTNVNVNIILFVNISVCAHLQRYLYPPPAGKELLRHFLGRREVLYFVSFCE